MELGLGFSRGFHGRTIWIVDAHRGDGKRSIVRADEKLSAFADYAQNRACFRSGEIRVLDSTGKLERTIAFSEADRRL